MTIKKINFVLFFTSIIFCLITVSLLLIFPIRENLSLTEINNNTFIAYRTSLKQINYQDQIIYLKDNIVKLDTVRSIDVGNRQIITNNNLIPYLYFKGKILFIIPFHYSLTISLLLSSLFIIVVVSCYFFKQFFKDLSIFKLCTNSLPFLSNVATKTNTICLSSLQKTYHFFCRSYHLSIHFIKRIISYINYITKKFHIYIQIFIRKLKSFFHIIYLIYRHYRYR